MDFPELSEQTRELMSDELELDIAAGTLYLSPRLAVSGTEYADLIRLALEARDAVQFANELRTRLRSHETRPTETKPRKVPINAADMLAEGEFNRFYVRALCRRAIAENRALEICRLKAVSNPRVESELVIGTRMDPQALLTRLRGDGRLDAALGVPQPNSGLSVRLVD